MTIRICFPRMNFYKRIRKHSTSSLTKITTVKRSSKIDKKIVKMIMET